MSKHVLITGANRGIGAAMVRALARPGHRVTLLCRDRVSGEALVRSLPPDHGAELKVLVGDLGTLAGIRAAIDTVRTLPALDVLIHNAAIWPQQKMLTADGLEQAFVTNHLAPFLFNWELESRLQKEGTRVVQITAGLYAMGERQYQATAIGANFSAFKTYASTKLLNLATTMTFAARWQGTAATINAIHPGVVRTDLGAMSGFKGFLLKQVKRLWLTPEQGAEAPLNLAMAPELQGVSGRFYDRFQEAKLAAFLQDPQFLAGVWEQALQFTRK